MKTPRVRDINSYHLVKKETASLKMVESIIMTFRGKRTHKFRPKNITSLAKKISFISNEYLDETGLPIKIGKSTLLREGGVYRPKLEAYLAQISGNEAINAQVNSASSAVLTVKVRDLQLELLEAKRNVNTLSMRLETSNGAVFKGVELVNTSAIEDEHHQLEKVHSLCSTILMMWTYLEKEKMNPFSFVNSEMIDSLSREVIVNKHHLSHYIDWLQKQNESQ